MKRTILLIIPNLGKGGAQQVFHQQLHDLSVNHRVTACVFNWDGAFDEDKLHNIISLDVPAGKDQLRKLFYFLTRIIRLRRLKKNHGIEISISHLEGADYVNILSRTTDQTVCWIHGSKFHDKNISGITGWLRKKILIPRLYRRASKLVTVSKGIELELITNIKGVKKICTTIYNGFDVKRIVELSSEPIDARFQSLFSESQVIITHCRLSKQKNLDALLLIFSKLERKDNVKLVILGDGELRDQLWARVSELGLQSYSCWSDEAIDLTSDVFFIGQQKNPFKFLRRASFYVMTSLWEGFPLALCEAMVCGLPVVVSDCFTGPREILTPEINVSQPIEFPLKCQYGFLMPLPDQSDSEKIHHWERIMHQMSNKEFLFQPALSVERINEFSISNSISRTELLIKTLS